MNDSPKAIPDTVQVPCPGVQRPYHPLLIRSVESHGLARINWPFAEQFRFTQDELTKLPLSAFIHSDDRAQLDAAAATTNGACEARHRTRDGEWVRLYWCFRDHDGQRVALGATDRRVVEQESVDVASPGDGDDGLSQTLNGMALVVEAKNPGMLCSILLVDEQREVITGGAGPSLPMAYNRAVEGLRIGPSVGSCGTAAFWNTPVVVEDIEKDPLWSELQVQARMAGVAACWSHPIVGSDGVVLGAMALYDTRPSAPERHQMDGLEIAARMVGLAVERHRLQQKLRQTEKMEALGLLAGGVAHDFNNLLAVIIGNSELALMSQHAGSEAAFMLNDVIAAGHSAAEMCSQILAYAGRGHASRAPVRCNTLIREVGSLLRAAMSKKATLRYALCDDECYVTGDAAQIQSVVMNLLTNASDAIGDQEGCITVSTSVRHYSRRDLQSVAPGCTTDPGPYVQLEVSDTGSGIDKQTQARIFDPFFSTKSRSRGLGLAAVQGIVRSHKGVLRLSSEAGVGTKFTVLLPNVQVPNETVVDTRAQTASCSTAYVLVADDEAMVRDAIARSLRAAGVNVLLAADGLQAVSMFSAQRTSIGCVLLDYSMPKLNGGEALREIRQLDANIPILLMSGFAEHGLLEQYSAYGLLAVLQKPTPRQVLLDKVFGALGPPR